MATTDISILYLLADLMRQPELRGRLASDPIGLFREYKIPDEKLAIMRSRSVERTVEVVGDEARAALEALDHQGDSQVGWFNKQPRIDHSAPPSGLINSVISFRIEGAYFLENATLSFQRPDVTVDASDVHVETDEMGNSTMTGNATFSVQGEYDVCVSNPGNPPETATVPLGFNAKE